MHVKSFNRNKKRIRPVCLHVCVCVCVCVCEVPWGIQFPDRKGKLPCFIQPRKQINLLQCLLPGVQNGQGWHRTVLVHTFLSAFPILCDKCSSLRSFYVKGSFGLPMLWLLKEVGILYACFFAFVSIAWTASFLSLFCLILDLLQQLWPELSTRWKTTSTQSYPKKWPPQILSSRSKSAKLCGDG